MKGNDAYYSLDLKIKDTRFSIDDLHEYSLLLQAGEREFQLAVVDTKTNRCLLLEHYNLHNISRDGDYLKLIEALFADHHLLMAGFWHSVKFSIKNSQFSLIPTALFDKDQLKAYLRLTSPVSASESLLYYRHLKNNLVTVFAADQSLLNWLQKRYPNLKVQVLHHISAFAEGILHQTDPSSQREMYVLQENDRLSVVLTHQGKLLYANLFRSTAPAELVRYLMMIIKQFELDQANTKVVLRGEISPDSGWYKEIRPFFGKLSFGGRPSYLSFSYMFDEVSEQRFFDLLSLHLCE